ncbi:MAG: hypothetical protein ACK4SQ_14390 [Allorhizobium sp.]
MRPNREAVAILTELGVEIVAKNVAPRPGQTRSVGTVQRIVRRHGVEHARLVVMMIVESRNNRVALDEASLGAVSDVLIAMKRSYPSVYSNEITKIFEFFDQTPIAAIRLIYTQGLEGVINKRAALGGMIWERVVRVFGHPQSDWLDDRRLASSPENAKV